MLKAAFPLDEVLVFIKQFIEWSMTMPTSFKLYELLSFLGVWR